MDQNLDKKREIISNCRTLALDIIEKLDEENIRKKLNVICMLEKIPDLSTDDEIKHMDEYRDLKGVLKKLYIEIARAIMSILNTKASFSCDPNSFNYTEPLDEMLAAEYIKLLPNAFIAGPMKAALNNPHVKVKKIAIDYYDSLPSDFKYSGIFPPDFKKIIREIKSQIKD